MALLVLRRLRDLILVVAIVLGNVSIASAQSQSTGGDLVGEARDELQGVLNGVVVSATNEATGLARSQTTGPDGHFAFRALPVGDYLVEAQLAGFEPVQGHRRRRLAGHVGPLEPGDEDCRPCL